MMQGNVDHEISELAVALVKRHGADALAKAQTNLRDAIEVRNAEAIQFWREVKNAVGTLHSEA